MRERQGLPKGPDRERLLSVTGGTEKLDFNQKKKTHPKTQHPNPKLYWLSLFFKLLLTFSFPKGAASLGKQLLLAHAYPFA